MDFFRDIATIQDAIRGGVLMAQDEMEFELIFDLLVRRWQAKFDSEKPSRLSKAPYIIRTYCAVNGNTAVCLSRSVGRRPPEALIKALQEEKLQDRYGYLRIKTSAFGKTETETLEPITALQLQTILDLSLDFMGDI